MNDTLYRLGEFQESELVALSQGTVPESVRLKAVEMLESTAQLWLQLHRESQRSENARLKAENAALKKRKGKAA